MDPVSQAVTDLQNAFRRFQADKQPRVFVIETAGKHVGTIAKVLRGEEWQLANRRPFLILPTAYRDTDDCFTQMRLQIEQHHRTLREGLSKDGIEVPPLADLSGLPPYEALVKTLRAFATSLPDDHLDPPLLAWFPTDAAGNWHSALLALWQALAEDGLRFAVAVKNQNTIPPLLAELDWEGTAHTFVIDEDAASDYTAKLMGEPALGRAKGTLPGCAAPDVEPPPRPGPPLPDEATVAKAREAANLPPTLTPEQGETLRRHVFLAGRAAGKQDKETTLREQEAAVALCREAGTGQEETLMTMVLANYRLQYGDEPGAEETYQQADELACRHHAFPQLAQTRMAIGYLQMKQKCFREAAETYEQAAWAGHRAESGMLLTECLRLAGTAWLQAKEPSFAAWSWQAGLDRAEALSAIERAQTQYRDMAARLIELYRGHGLQDKAEAVTRQLGAAEDAAVEAQA